MNAQAPVLLQVFNPFNQELIAALTATPATACDKLIQQAKDASVVMAKMPRHQRADMLSRAAAAIASEAEAFAQCICAESGKPIMQARKEVSRCVNTLTLSAEAAKGLCGEQIPFDSFAGNEGRSGYYSKEPLGIILAITPFNDPLNLVAHKVGPALAAGNAVLLKPSEKAPLSALMLVDCLLAAGAPEFAVQPIIGDKNLMPPYLSSPLIRMVSFTGGMQTGESIAKQAGLKRLAMDLGGNAANIVFKSCDLVACVDACVSGGFWANGHNCISVQRILLQSDIAYLFNKLFVEAVKGLAVGDPQLETTFVGPMIDEAAVNRTQGLVEDAIAAGASLLCGGKNSQGVFLPTVLSNVPTDHPLWLEEVFAPLVCIREFDNFDEAIALANQPDYALHAAVFSNDLTEALVAIEQLEAGGVMINDSSDFRFDGMPFGGSKLGSMGREGVEFAMEEMSQTKVVCFNQPGS